MRMIIAEIDTLDGKLTKSVVIEESLKTLEFDCKEFTSLNLICVRCEQDTEEAVFIKIDL